MRPDCNIYVNFLFKFHDLLVDVLDLMIYFYSRTEVEPDGTIIFHYYSTRGGLARIAIGKTSR